MSKYKPLSDRLTGQAGDEWRASFAELEEVLGFPLPKTARSGQAWWESADKPHSRAWSGWQADADPTAQMVTFRRGSASRPAAGAAHEAPPPATKQAAETASKEMRVKQALGVTALAAAGAALVAGIGALVVRGMRGRR